MDVLPTCVSVHLAPTVSKEAGRGHWNWSYIIGGCETAVIWKLGIQPDFSEPGLFSTELWLYSLKRKLLSTKSSTSFMRYIFNHF